jgi:hypothetical protein
MHRPGWQEARAMQEFEEATLPEPNKTSFSAKLWRLHRDLLLALLNATAILVIIAAILALVAIMRINNFAGNVVATMTESALSKIDLPSRDVLVNLRELTTEVRTLGNTLRELKEENKPVLQAEVARLREALNTLSSNVDRLRSARTIFTDEAIGRLSQAVGDTLTRMRGCSVDAGQMRSDHPAGDPTMDLTMDLAAALFGREYDQDHKEPNRSIAASTP